MKKRDPKYNWPSRITVWAINKLDTQYATKYIGDYLKMLAGHDL